MRNSSNNKLIILSFLVVLCLFAFYKVTKYYSSKDIEPIVRENVNVADVIDKDQENSQSENNIKYSEEINLGDSETVGCKTMEYFCPTGTTSHPTDSHSCMQRIDGTASNCSGWVYMNTCYKVSSKKTRCTSCPEGATLKGGLCYKSLDCTVTFSAPERTSPGSNISVGINYIGKDCEGLSVSVSSGDNCSGSSSTTLGSGNYRFLRIKAGNKCSTATYTVSGPGITKTFTTEVVSEWTPSSQKYFDYKLPITESSADKAGSDWHGTCWEIEGGKYECSGVYHRACGGGGGGTTTEQPACYADASVLSLATSAKWIVPSKVDSVHHIKVSGITKEADCVAKNISDPEYCNPTSKACSKSDKTANSCEENLNAGSYEDGLDCPGKPFYTINCTNTPTIKFDNGDDGRSDTAITLYAGQGFKYGVTITIERTCKATFNKDIWKNAYETINKKINRVNGDLSKATGDEKTRLTSELNRLKAILNEITSAVTTYNKYNPSTSYNEGGKLSVEYKVNNVSKTDEVTFEKKVLQEGSGSYSNKQEVSLGVSGITNPSNYTWSNASNPRKTKLILPKTYIDEKTGAVSTTGLDGGNKFYLDYNIDPGTYPITVTLSGIGCNSNINNNKCNVKVGDYEIIYRPIDVSNPFINNKWTPGTNWINSQFDFRNIIHSDIWSK